MNLLRIGVRPSPLSVKQAEEIRNFFSWVKFEIIKIATLGDKDKLTPLASLEGADFFTREIDQALLDGEIDLALHSSKDLPDKLAKGLKVLWESRALSPFDVLVAKEDLKLAELPAGSRIGTSSLRRTEQLQAFRPDLEIVNIRGNIGERLALLDHGKIDALIVAQAALIRLGLEGRVSQVLNIAGFSAHPKQGKLSLVVREDRWEKVKFILSAQARETGS